MSTTIRVTVWNEFLHEKSEAKVGEVYPEGIHGAIAKALSSESDMKVRTATLEEPEHGLTQDVLDNTDVLFWWGHMGHDRVSDDVVRKVHARVLEGMGFVALHSAHFSKPFKMLMGTHCSLKWREDGAKERLWNVAPSHPVTRGLGEYFELPHTEMYGERFDIPEPDQLIFISWFKGGEVFRSGCAWNRGAGRVFYFRPGHETFPIYRDANVQTVLRNAARWAAATVRVPFAVPRVEPLEAVEPLQATDGAHGKSAAGSKGASR